MYNSIKTLFICFSACLLSVAAFGKDYCGTYTLTSGNVTLTLVLDQDASGRITGTLSSTKGVSFHLEGQIEEGIAVGTCTGEEGESYFEAEFENSKLIFTLVEVGSDGYGDSRSMEFIRTSDGTHPPAKTNSAKPAPQAQAPSPTPSSPEKTLQGQRVSDPNLGIAFVPPSGWTAQSQQGMMILSSTTYKGFIVIQPHGYTSVSQISQEAAEGIIDEENGIYLSPSSGFQAFSANGLAGEFSGSIQGVQAKAFAIGLISPHGGGGVTIMATVESASYSNDYADFVRSIASSLAFTASQTSMPSGGGATDSNLMNYFKGEYYYYSGGSTIYGGAGTERTVTLCPDGLYRDSYEFSASGSEWGSANTQQGAARWTIQGDTTQGVITVTYSDGQRKQVTYEVLSKSEGTILFNGIKFVYAGAPKCR